MQKQKYNLQGLVVSLDTPFHADGSLDLESFRRLLDWHLDQGAVGFLTPAQAGEVGELSGAEKLDLIRFAQVHAGGRALIVASATSTQESESFEVAEEAVRAGCGGVLCEVPPARRGNKDQTQDFFRELAAVGMPMLMIQDLDWGGSGMDVAIIRQMFEEIDSFRCLKVEVQPAGPKYSAVVEATTGRLHVSGGWAVNQMIEAMDRGVDVFMNTGLTGIYRRIMEAYWANNRPEAHRWFYKMLPVLAFTQQHLDVSIHFFKRYFQRRGVFTTPNVRKKSNAFDSFHTRYCEEVLDYIDEVERAAGYLK